VLALAKELHDKYGTGQIVNLLDREVECPG